jgi:Nif-specific regulatory protein
VSPVAPPAHDDAHAAAGRPASPAARAPAHDGDDDEELDDAGIDDGRSIRIGPVERLPGSPSSASAGQPPASERERLIWAMEQCGWVQAKAARLLRITPRQLGYALQKHRIEVRKF